MIYFIISGSTTNETRGNAVKSMLLAVLTMRETVILRIVTFAYSQKPDSREGAHERHALFFSWCLFMMLFLFDQGSSYLAIYPRGAGTTLPRVYRYHIATGKLYEIFRFEMKHDTTRNPTN